MAKPDKPGFWKSQNGGRACVYNVAKGRFGESVLSADRLTHDGFIDSTVMYPSDLPCDDWLPCRDPEFPAQPLKPRIGQCLVYLRVGCRVPLWRVFNLDGPFAGTEIGSGFRAKEYEVAPHPENDPAAVQLIEEAGK